MGKKSATKQSGLVGKFFHSIKDGKVCWQGRVLSEPKPGFYLIATYDWLVGEEHDQQLLPIEQMVGWLFYDSNEDMVHSYSHGAAKKFRSEKNNP